MCPRAGVGDCHRQLTRGRSGDCRLGAASFGLNTMRKKTLYFTDAVSPDFLGLTFRTEVEAYAEFKFHSPWCSSHRSAGSSRISARSPSRASNRAERPCGHPSRLPLSISSSTQPSSQGALSLLTGLRHVTGQGSTHRDFFGDGGGRHLSVGARDRKNFCGGVIIFRPLGPNGTRIGTEQDFVSAGTEFRQTPARDEPFHHRIKDNKNQS